MATYTSKPATLNMSFGILAERLDDFSNLQRKLDELPSEQRQKLGDVNFTKDSIEMMTPQVGKICLNATERTPGRLVLKASSSPVPMELSLNYEPAANDTTTATARIDVDLPMMLKPLVGPAIQKAVDQMGAMFSSLL